MYALRRLDAASTKDRRKDEVRLAYGRQGSLIRSTSMDIE
jgi:hypothetical protein